MDSLADIIVAMQHRNRVNVHAVKGIRAFASNTLHLYNRSGDPQKLERALKIIVTRCIELEEAMQNDCMD
jgi:hypothetical protein